MVARLRHAGCGIPVGPQVVKLVAGIGARPRVSGGVINLDLQQVKARTYFALVAGIDIAKKIDHVGRHPA